MGDTRLACAALGLGVATAQSRVHTSWLSPDNNDVYVSLQACPIYGAECEQVPRRGRRRVPANHARDNRGTSVPDLCLCVCFIARLLFLNHSLAIYFYNPWPLVISAIKCPRAVAVACVHAVTKRHFASLLDAFFCRAIFVSSLKYSCN